MVGLLDRSSLSCSVTWWWVRPLPIMQCVHQSLKGTCVASCSSLSFCAGLFLGPASRAVALLFLTPNHTPYMYSFCSTVPRRSVSPTPSPRMAQTLVLASCHAIFQMASSRLDPSASWTRCYPHVPPTTAKSGSLLGVLLVSSSPHGT